MTAPTTCPKCGSADAKPIVYGTPPEEIAFDPDVEIGGCVLEEGAPAFRCVRCGETFGEFKQEQE